MASTLGSNASVVPVGAGGADALKNLGTEPKISSSSGTIEVGATIVNLTSKLLYNGEQKNWPGTTGTLNGRIASGTYFSPPLPRTGTLPAGAKFGMVYTDSDQQLPTTRKFVVAFDTPTGKVYAESGPIGPIDWDVVEDRLGKSERKTTIVDDILGGRIDAEVYENGNVIATFRDT